MLPECCHAKPPNQASLKGELSTAPTPRLHFTNSRQVASGASPEHQSSVFRRPWKVPPTQDRYAGSHVDCALPSEAASPMRRAVRHGRADPIAGLQHQVCQPQSPRTAVPAGSVGDGISERLPPRKINNGNSFGAPSAHGCQQSRIVFQRAGTVKSV